MDEQYNYDSEVIQARKSEYPIHPILLSRTSPRHMTGEDIPTDQLMRLFEASRWAPSHYNVQPWRFVYVKRDSNNWQKFLDLLVPPNREWAQHAGALIVVISQRYYYYNETKLQMPSNSFDAGAAWIQMALEGTALGLVVHAMGGFDYEKTYEVIGVPKEAFNVEAIIAVGKRPPKEDRKQENISQRKAINTFVFEGQFVDNDST